MPRRTRKNAPASSALRAAASGAMTVAAPPSLIPASLSAFAFEFLLVLLFIGGTTGCIVTGFGIPVYGYVLSAGLTLSAVLSVLFMRAGRLRLPFCSLAVIGMGIWAWLRIDTLLDGLLCAAVAVYRYLCWGFTGLQMPPLLAEYEQTLLYAEATELLAATLRAQVTESLLFLGLLLSLIFCWLYVRRRAVWLCALLPLPGFVLCFLIIEATMPDIRMLAMLLVFWALLLFTRSAVRLHPRAASAQAAFLLLPVLLFLFGIYAWYPRDISVGALVQSGYDKVMDAVSFMESTAARVSDGFVAGTWFNVSAEGSEISFDSLSPRRYLGRTVMKAKCDTTGAVYLRENTYSTYTGDGWEQTDTTTAADPQIQTASAEILAASGVSASRLTLDGARSSLLFSPYYFSDASVVYAADGDARISNPDRIADYEVAFYRFPGVFSELQYTTADAADASVRLSHYSAYGLEPYLQIDETLMQKLRSLLDENGITVKPFEEIFIFENGVRTVTIYENLWETVSDITRFVRGSAAYSLNASANPTDKDFVLWFLEDAELGYCTHFATAEVMLLRACGIPARLAAGFLGNITRADTWTAIKDSNAHAWVEVFDVRLGWIPVEATPPGSLSGVDSDEDPVAVPALPEESAEDTAISTDTTEAVSLHDDPSTMELTQDTAASTHPVSPDRQNTGDAVVGIGGTGTDGDSGGSGVGHLPGQEVLGAVLRALGITMLIVLSGTLLVLLFIWYRRSRHRQMESLLSPEESDINARALQLCRRCAAIAAETGEALPTELTALAEKARFSHHTLTKDEFSVISDWYRQRTDAMRISDRPAARFRHYWMDMYY